MFDEPDECPLQLVEAAVVLQVVWFDIGDHDAVGVEHHDVGAAIAGDVEEELPGWTITVGPREAAHIPGFLRGK